MKYLTLKYFALALMILFGSESAFSSNTVNSQDYGISKPNKYSQSNEYIDIGMLALAPTGFLWLEQKKNTEREDFRKSIFKAIEHERKGWEMEKTMAEIHWQQSKDEAKKFLHNPHFTKEEKGNVEFAKSILKRLENDRHELIEKTGQLEVLQRWSKIMKEGSIPRDHLLLKQMQKETAFTQNEVVGALEKRAAKIDRLAGYQAVTALFASIQFFLLSSNSNFRPSVLFEKIKPKASLVDFIPSSDSVMMPITSVVVGQAQVKGQ